ncbi:MAG: hypothetical protein OEQ53_03450 [Saprospiraceae bacterium]|nr:hypothetical protein [Saprospiraceae bacterium]
MSTTTFDKIRQKPFLSTLREDRWWVGPAAVLGGLTAFIVYGTWAGLQETYYWVGSGGFGGYLAPFDSPTFFVKEGLPGVAPLSHGLFGSWPTWWPDFLPASPALIILVFPAVFRFTCYYYRKAYYRAFTFTPPACAVGALPRKRKAGYLGETGLMVIQNLHRYTMILVIPFIIFFFYDAFLAFFRSGEFGVGIGTILILGNPITLALYTFGCHSWRHLIGGRRDCFSCDARSKFDHGSWKFVTKLNQHHQLWAWVSLIWIVTTDFYVRMVSMGQITDLNTW